MKRKYIFIIDAVILVGTLLSLFFVFSYSKPILLSPDLKQNELFRFSNCFGDCWILVDDNPLFDSPEKYYLERGLKINLGEGVYYWKTEGIFENHESIKLTTLTEVNLIALKEGNDYLIVNSEDEQLAVEIFNENEEVIESFDLTSGGEDE